MPDFTRVGWNECKNVFNLQNENKSCYKLLCMYDLQIDKSPQFPFAISFTNKFAKSKITLSTLNYKAIS